MGILTPQIVNLSPKAHSHTFLSISESAGFVLSLHSGRHSLPAGSDIYAGFKKHPEIRTNEKLYYAALVLLLERGWPVTERVLSGSMGPPPAEPPRLRSMFNSLDIRPTSSPQSQMSTGDFKSRPSRRCYSSGCIKRSWMSSQCPLMLRSFLQLETGALDSSTRRGSLAPLSSR